MLGRLDCVAEAEAKVTYAPDWSIKAGATRTPHLSTIDAIVLASWMAQFHLISIGVDADAITHAWVSELSVRAGSQPVETIEAVPVRILHESTSPSESPGWSASILKIDVGMLMVELTIQHENASGPALPAPGVANGERFKPDVYARLFNSTQHQAEVTSLTESAIECRVDLVLQAGSADGLSGAYWPELTFMDCVVIGGQMAEILNHARSGTARDSSSTLWMRRIRFKAPHPSTQVSSVGWGRIIKSNEFERDGMKFSMFDMEGAILGVQMSVSCAERTTAGR